jgi:hypothetical protein
MTLARAERSATKLGRPAQVARSRTSGWRCSSDSPSQRPLPTSSSHTIQKRPGRQNTQRR